MPRFNKTLNKFDFPAGVFILMFGLVLTAGAVEAREYSSLRYPLPGNISREEGTIEFWMKPYDDPYEEGERFYDFYLFSVRCDDDSQLGFFWKYPVLGGRILASYVGERLLGEPSMRPFMRRYDKSRWGQGEWQHFAVTWEDDGMVRIFFGGEQAAGSRLARPLVLLPEGYVNFAHAVSAMAIDQVVISATARSAEEIMRRTEGPVEIDEYTLLLDTFEDIDKEAHETRAEMISGFSGEKGGSIIGNAYEVVEGKFGNALKMFREK